jgi:hypothetical protein
MTERPELKANIGAEIEQSDLETIVEEIRLSALNMGINAAGLKLSGESRSVIRKKISDLINISLDTVTRLAHVFDAMRSGSHDEADDPSVFIDELQTIETTIRDRSAEVIDLLKRAGLDEQ